MRSTAVDGWSYGSPTTIENGPYSGIREPISDETLPWRSIPSGSPMPISKSAVDVAGYSVTASPCSTVARCRRFFLQLGMSEGHWRK